MSGNFFIRDIYLQTYQKRDKGKIFFESKNQLCHAHQQCKDVFEINIVYSNFFAIYMCHMAPSTSTLKIRFSNLAQGHTWTCCLLTSESILDFQEDKLFKSIRYIFFLLLL